MFSLVLVELWGSRQMTCHVAVCISKVSSFDGLINMSFYISLYCINDRFCVTFFTPLWGPGFERLLVCLWRSTGRGLVLVWQLLLLLVLISCYTTPTGTSRPQTRFHSPAVGPAWVGLPGGTHTALSVGWPSGVPLAGTREPSGGLSRIPHFCRRNYTGCWLLTVLCAV